MADGTERTRIESALLIPEQSRGYWPEILAVSVLVLILGATAGPVGIIAGLVTAAVWYRFGTPFAVAIGHILLVVVFPTGITLNTVVIVETVFLALLVVPLVRTPFRLQTAMAGTTTVLGLLGTSWFITRSYSLWLATLLCIGVISLGLYIVHRHGLITLGLVSENEREDQTITTETATQSTHE